MLCVWVDLSILLSEFGVGSYCSCFHDRYQDNCIFWTMSFSLQHNPWKCWNLTTKRRLRHNRSLVISTASILLQLPKWSENNPFLRGSVDALVAVCSVDLSLCWGRACTGTGLLSETRVRSGRAVFLWKPMGSESRFFKINKCLLKFLKSEHDVYMYQKKWDP